MICLMNLCRIMNILGSTVIKQNDFEKLALYMGAKAMLTRLFFIMYELNSYIRSSLAEYIKYF